MSLTAPTIHCKTLPFQPLPKLVQRSFQKNQRPDGHYLVEPPAQAHGRQMVAVGWCHSSLNLDMTWLSDVLVT